MPSRKARPTVVIVFDTVLDVITLVTPVRRSAGMTAEAAMARAVDRLTAVVDALDRPLIHEAAGDGTTTAEAPRSNTAPAEFRVMVDKAKGYILAGDIFQVVLAQRFEAPFTLPAFALYRALRRVLSEQIFSPGECSRAGGRAAPGRYRIY